MRDIFEDDRKMMKNIFRSYHVITDQAKIVRKCERSADDFRCEGTIYKKTKRLRDL